MLDIAKYLLQLLGNTCKRERINNLEKEIYDKIANLTNDYDKSFQDYSI